MHRTCRLYAINLYKMLSTAERYLNAITMANTFQTIYIVPAMRYNNQ